MISIFSVYMYMSALHITINRRNFIIGKHNYNMYLKCSSNAFNNYRK